MSNLNYIVGETVKSALVKAIRNHFKTANDEGIYTYPTIYKELGFQDMITPYFFVREIEIAQSKQMLDTYNRTYFMEVRYHLDPNNKELSVNEILSQVGNDLHLVLRKVDVTNYAGVELPVIGYDAKYSINDGVLIFLVNYDIRLRVFETPGIPMEELELNDELII